MNLDFSNYHFLLNLDPVSLFWMCIVFFSLCLFSITFQICLIASCSLWFDDIARRWWKEGKPDNIVPSCWPANSGVPPAHHDARYCCLIVDGIWKMGSSCRVYWDYSEDTFRFSSQSQLRGGLFFRCPKDLAFAFSTQKNSRVSIIIEKLLQIGLKTEVILVLCNCRWSKPKNGGLVVHRRP